jgi:hypothetical protein
MGLNVHGKEENLKYIYGVYSHEDALMSAIKEIRADGLEIDDVYSPFPVHFIDDALGIKETNLQSAGFMLGLTGTVTALGLITWIVTINYPILFGGKPFWSLPAFIPITFEATVLMASVGMFFVYIIRNELFPGKVPMILDERTTDDKFAIAFGIDHKSDADVAKIKSALEKSGAEEVNNKSFE